jgi:hypothetical protein
VLQNGKREKEFLVEQNIFHVKKAIETFMKDFQDQDEVSSPPKKTAGFLKHKISYFFLFCWTF